jgi:hypothetical protein
LFKAKPGVLCCGLFGGSFNEPITGKILHRLKTLGFFNQQRGEDSCGIYNGDELLKGVDANKKFYNFVVNVGIPPNKGKNNVFIGHTRRATMGVHSAENAHPYNIDNKLIFAHNGKIENAWPLCRENDIETMPLNVDSQGLGHLLAKVGPKILAEYKGYAAILAHDLSKQGVLYAYHGASKEFKSDQLPREERPLFFMETPEGFYFSSMEEALLFIKDENDNKPITVPHNILFTFKNGKVIKQSKKIDREEKNVYVYEAPVQTKTVYQSHSETTNSKIARAWGGCGYNRITTSTEEKPYLNISLENLPKEFVDRERIYYYRNRYWINTEKCNGSLTVNSEGKVVKDTDTAIKRTTMYFYKGIYLKGDKEYKLIHRQLQNVESDLMKTISYPNRNFAKLMSKWSKYPITNIDQESSAVDEEFRKRFYHNEKEVGAESIRPIFSERIYTYKEGRLTSVTTGGTSDEKFFLDPSPKSGGEEEKGNGLGGGVQGTGSEDEKSKKSADEKRRALVSDICARLRLDKVSPDLERAIALFYTKYENLVQLKAAMLGIGNQVAKLYCIDVMQTLCGQSNPRESIVFDAMEELYKQAIYEKVPLAELMEDGIEDPEYYIGEILENWDFQDEPIDATFEDLIEVVPTESFEPPFDPTVPVVIKATPVQQTDIFKNFDKKKD